MAIDREFGPAMLKAIRSLEGAQPMAVGEPAWGVDPGIPQLFFGVGTRERNAPQAGDPRTPAP